MQIMNNYRQREFKDHRHRRRMTTETIIKYIGNIKRGNS